MLTLTEWAKLNPTPLQSGVVEIFSRENPVLERLQFQNVAGSAFKYNIETALPGIAFRDFNQGYTESTGVVNPVTENLTIIGGDSDFDVAQIAMGTGDNDTRAVHDAMKAKALTLNWLTTFFDGDSGTNPLEFDGLNTRLTGNQVIEAGTNGAALDMDMLDVLVDSVNGTPSMLMMNKAMRREVRKLARNSNVLSISRDFFGREVDAYQGIPIGIVEEDASGADILGFDEEQGSNNETASIYAVRFGPDALHGIQTQPMSVRDLGEIDAKPAYRTRVEWYSSIVIKHPRAAARLKGVIAS
ncbi:MAG: major capsid protein [Pseudomonadota bacterium]